MNENKQSTNKSSEQNQYRRSRGNYAHHEKKGVNSYFPFISLIILALAILFFMFYVVHGELANRDIKSNDVSTSVVKEAESVSEDETTEDDGEATADETTEEEAANSDEKVVLSGEGTSGSITLNDASSYVTAQFILKDSTTTAWFSMSNTELTTGLNLSASGYPGYEVTLGANTSSEIKIKNAANLYLVIDGQEIDLSQYDQTEEVTLALTVNHASTDGYNGED